MSNEDLLEILGQSKEPEKVQKHIKKCFEAIAALDFQISQLGKGWKLHEVKGMKSPEGEVVRLQIK